MRLVLQCATIAAVLAALTSAANPTRRAPVTVVLEFQTVPATTSLAEMKREVETLFGPSGITFDWRSRSEAVGRSFANLVVVRFKGKCVIEPAPWLLDERGPMAFTYSTSGVVQPFSEVECDHVSAAARSAMWGDDFAHADLLLGRALGRVVAHEVLHILAKSGDHGHDGVAKPALSGTNLIEPGLRLNPADLARVYTEP